MTSYDVDILERKWNDGGYSADGPYLPEWENDGKISIYGEWYLAYEESLIYKAIIEDDIGCYYLNILDR